MLYSEAQIHDVLNKTIIASARDLVIAALSTVKPVEVMRWVEVKSESDLPEGEHLYEWRYSQVHQNLTYERMDRKKALTLFMVNARDIKYLNEKQ